MKPMFLRAWLIGTVFGSSTFGLIGAAAAQTGPVAATPTQGLATITVVARKKPENLQRVPLSVTAISAKTLKQAHVENLHDIIALTPGVNVSDAGAEAVTSITIRGDTDQTFGVNIPDTATFLDDAYIRDPAAINVAAIPLQQVEVIKGPVSALYGRDAYAGVLNYIIARPTTTPHADISETAGNDGKSELQGDISGPVYGDKVLGELFGDFDTFNGTYKDKVSGVSAGGYQKKDFGGLLDVNWNQNITTHLDYYYGYDYFDNAAVERLTPNCGTGTEVNADGSANFGAQNLYCGQVKSGRTVNIGNDPAAGNPGNERRTFYISGNNTFAYDWGTITSVSAASQVDEQAIQLFDASSTGQPYPLQSDAAPGVQNGYALEHSFYGSSSRTGNASEELRYASPQDLPIRVGAGGFAYSETRFDTSAASASELNIPPGESLVNIFGVLDLFATPTGAVGKNVNSDKHTTNEEAGFASAEADLLPNLTIASQYRYTWYHQNFRVTNNEYTGPGGPAYHSAEEYFATNESIRYFPIPNQMLYFAFANGEKPGGFNSGATPTEAAFGPETDLDFEGGFKTQLLENHLQIDATAYHVDVTNLQLYVPLADGSEIIEGEGKTANTGFEVDVRALPVDGLTITGGFNYNNPTFNSGSYDAADAYNCAELPACAAKEKTVGGLLEEPVGGNTVPLSSKETVSVAAEYDFLAMDQFPAYVRGDYSYKSSQFTDPSNLTSIGASSDLDLFAGISRGRYTLSAYVKNVTDNLSPVFFQYDTTLDYFNKVPTVVLPPGRTFAFTIAAKF
jgi:iron complex outermembrane receptor protein